MAKAREPEFPEYLLCTQRNSQRPPIDFMMFAGAGTILFPVRRV
jgi:hypothetical protein